MIKWTCKAVRPDKHTTDEFIIVTAETSPLMQNSMKSHAGYFFKAEVLLKTIIFTPFHQHTLHRC